jgi:hypothetical protein
MQTPRGPEPASLRSGLPCSASQYQNNTPKRAFPLPSDGREFAQRAQWHVCPSGQTTTGVAACPQGNGDSRRILAARDGHANSHPGNRNGPAPLTTTAEPISSKPVAKPGTLIWINRFALWRRLEPRGCRSPGSRRPPLAGQSLRTMLKGRMGLRQHTGCRPSQYPQSQSSGTGDKRQRLRPPTSDNLDADCMQATPVPQLPANIALLHALHRKGHPGIVGSACLDKAQ